VLGALERHGFVARAPHEDDRDGLINDASQKALERFDETMRELALVHYQDFERSLGPVLAHFAVAETVRRIKAGTPLIWPIGLVEEKTLAELAQKLTPDFGSWLAKHPSLEDAARINKETAQYLRERGVLEDVAAALALKENPLASLQSRV